MNNILRMIHEYITIRTGSLIAVDNEVGYLHRTVSRETSKGFHE